MRTALPTIAALLLALGAAAGNDEGMPGVRGMPASTFAASGDSDTVRAPLDGRYREAAQFWKNMVAHDQAEPVLRVGAAADLDMGAQEPPGQVSDRRFRFRRNREGRLAPPDAVDDGRCLAAGRIGRHLAMLPQGDPLRPGRTAG